MRADPVGGMQTAYLGVQPILRQACLQEGTTRAWIIGKVLGYLKTILGYEDRTFAL